MSNNTKKATPAAERKKAERERRKEKGFVRKELWTLPENWEKIQKFCDKLHKNI